MNEAVIRKHYNFLNHAKQTEIRVLGKHYLHGKSFFVDNGGDFVRKVTSFNYDNDVFVGINEREENSKSDKNVTSCEVIPIDVDSLEKKDIKQVEEKLEDIGLKYSHKVMSGNGVHYYIPIKCITDNREIHLILRKAKSLFKTLKMKFDPQIYNPERVMRIWGTDNKKRGESKEVTIVEEKALNESEILNNYNIVASYYVKEYQSQKKIGNQQKICPIIEYIFLNTIEKENVKKNNKLFKNAAVFFYKRLGNSQATKDILIRIAKRQNHNPNEILGWLKKVKEEAITDFYCGELRDWQEEHEINIHDCNSCDYFKDIRYFKEEILELVVRDNKKIEATEKMAEDFLSEEHVFTTRNDEKSETWIYKDGIYVPQARTYTKEYCRKVLGPAYTPYLCNQVIAKIEADTFIKQEDLFINEDVNKIALKNGILNLKTKKLEPFNHKYKFFNKIPVEFKPKNDCPSIKKFLGEVLKSDEDIKVMQEIFGYLLYRDYKIEKALMMTGDGRNGKGKTTELMKRFIGAENCANIPLDALEKDNFAMSELFNKMANLSADISNTALKNTGEFKKLTGHDLVSASRKFLTKVNFVNYAKMIFCANELPTTNDITTAFFNRWVMIDFIYTFLSQKEINALPPNEKQNVKLADTGIIEKISTPEELSGLLNWALEGLDRLLEKGDFSYSTSTQEVKTNWLRKSSSFNAFLMDEIKEDYESRIKKRDLREAYARYCKKHKLRMVSDFKIKEILTTTFGVTDGRDQSNPIVVSFWEGIKFKEKNIGNIRDIGE